MRGLGTVLEGVLIGLALLVLVTTLEDHRSGQKWDPHEVAIAIVALAVGVGGAVVMVFA